MPLNISINLGFQIDLFRKCWYRWFPILSHPNMFFFQELLTNLHSMTFSSFKQFNFKSLYMLFCLTSSLLLRTPSTLLLSKSLVPSVPLKSHLFSEAFSWLPTDIPSLVFLSFSVTLGWGDLELYSCTKEMFYNCYANNRPLLAVTSPHFFPWADLE